MSITITLAVACVIFVLFTFIVASRCKRLQQENKSQKEEIEKQKEIVVEVYKHAEEVAKIKKDQSQVNQKINEAKTDEEISNIISGILASNNSRLRK